MCNTIEPIVEGDNSEQARICYGLRGDSSVCASKFGAPGFPFAS